jgi:hypothetical protein
MSGFWSASRERRAETVRKPRAGLASFFAQGVENGGSADGEADDGSERGDQHEVRAEAKNVGEYGSDCEDQSQHVQPKRSADFGASFGAQISISAQTQLRQQSGESDGGHDDQGERTGKRRAAGVDDDQSEREQEEAGGQNAPAAGLPR